MDYQRIGVACMGYYQVLIIWL
uniref:Uncharacterized protein n=1 Tax=Arundo donax TaxID=35708 RepID=A0A0A9E6W9_ARUDO